MAEFFSMGGYAPFIWPAYGIAVLVIGGLYLWTLRALVRAERSEAQLGSRSRRRAPKVTQA